MNMVFNPMSTTIGRSITLLHPEPPFSLPSTGSLEAQSGGVQRAYYTRLCVCVCVWVSTWSEAVWITLLAKAVGRLVLKRGWNWQKWWKMWQPPWWVGLMIVVSLLWQMRLKRSRYVKLGLARFWQSPVENRTNWVLELYPECLC